MDSVGLLLWIVPILFVTFFIYTLFSRGRNNKSDFEFNQRTLPQSKWKSLFVLAIILILVGGTIFAFNKFYRMSCPTAISPQEFAEMVNQDMNYKAEIFHRNNFRKSYTPNNRGDFLYIKGERVLDGDTPKWSEIYETIENENGYPGWMHYEIKAKRKFEKYFKYIVAIGGKKIPISNTDYIYNNTIFRNGGFNGRTERYVIFIANEPAP